MDDTHLPVAIRMFLHLCILYIRQSLWRRCFASQRLLYIPLFSWKVCLVTSQLTVPEPGSKRECSVHFLRPPFKRCLSVSISSQHLIAIRLSLVPLYVYCYKRLCYKQCQSGQDQFNEADQNRVVASRASVNSNWSNKSCIAHTVIVESFTEDETLLLLSSTES